MPLVSIQRHIGKDNQEHTEHSWTCKITWLNRNRAQSRKDTCKNGSSWFKQTTSMPHNLALSHWCNLLSICTNAAPPHYCAPSLLFSCSLVVLSKLFKDITRKITNKEKGNVTRELTNRQNTLKMRTKLSHCPCPQTSILALTVQKHTIQ